MSISTNYNNYYYMQMQYLANSMANAQLNSGNTDSSQNETETMSIPRRHSEGNGNMMGLSFSGKIMRDSLQSQGTDSSQMSDPMAKIKEDMDSIKSADIDNMSSDDIKATLTKLQSDMQSIPRPDGSTDDTQQTDISSMSESDMKNMLKKIQEQAKNMPEAGNMPPMMGRFDPSMMLNGLSGTQGNADTSGSESDTQNVLQQIVDNLTQSYDSSTESSDDYVKKLKESLTSMFNQDKSSIDGLSEMIFNKLDNWNSEEKAKTQEV